MILPEVTEGDAFQDCTASKMKVKAQSKNAVAIPVRKTSRNLIVIGLDKGSTFYSITPSDQPSTKD